jgi:BirA family biotin operon repressor/biotin-[acetyl-CoA-carboxylase] ligase
VSRSALLISAAPLDLELVKSSLRTAYLGPNIVYFQSIGSTNDVAQELAKQHAPEGTLVIADEQTAGRGRLGRAWLSPANHNLLMSLIFYPPLAASQAQRLTMLCSLAAADAIHAVAGLEVEIKWPNDLLLGARKTCGILTELGLARDSLAYAVVGIGLNVNLRAEQMPEELRSIATSLAEGQGGPVSREELLCAMLREIEARYERLKQGESPVREWASRLVTLGKPVQVSDAEESVTAWAEDVDEDGALLIRLSDGRRRRVLAGDVTLRQDRAA